jgi:hypothetical protein
VDLGGNGVELAWHPIDMGGMTLGIRGGLFQDQHTANDQGAYPFYAREQVKTSGQWGNLEAQTVPFYGFSFSAGIGALNYSVDTRIESNSSTYVYEGLTGSHAVMLLGLGGQFEVPWKFALKPYVAGRIGWTAGSSDRLESGIGQFSAGMTWRF